jgi:hypothetical protein
MMAEAGQWLPFAALFVRMIHPKYGHYVTLPADGGMLDQPAETMGVLEHVKAEYVAYLIEQNKR